MLSIGPRTNNSSSPVNISDIVPPGDHQYRLNHFSKYQTPKNFRFLLIASLVLFVRLFNNAVPQAKVLPPKFRGITQQNSRTVQFGYFGMHLECPDECRVSAKRAVRRAGMSIRPLAPFLSKLAVPFSRNDFVVILTNLQ